VGYRTIFPVAWFGAAGWKLREDAASKKGKRETMTASTDMTHEEKMREWRAHEQARREQQVAIAASGSDRTTLDWKRVMEEGRRDLGIGAPILRLSFVQPVARWMGKWAVPLSFLGWALLVGLCLAMEYAWPRAIAKSVSAEYLRETMDFLREHMTALYRGGFSMLEPFARLYGMGSGFINFAGQLLLVLPLTPLIALLHLNRTRALVSLFMLVATLATGFHYLMRATGVERRMRRTGAYPVLVLKVGVVLAPMAVLGVMAAKVPLVTAWSLDHITLFEAAKILGTTFAIAVVSVYLSTLSEGEYDEESGGYVVDEQQSKQQQSKLAKGRIAHLDPVIKALTTLVAVLGVYLLVGYVRPESIAPLRAAAMLDRTAGWREGQ